MAVETESKRRNERMLRERTRELQRKTGEKAYQERQRLRTSLMLRTTLFAFTMAFVLMTAFLLYYKNYPFNTYSVAYELELSDLRNTSFYAYRTGSILLGSDSVTYLEGETVIYTQPISYRDPVLKVRGDYYAVYDKSGYEISVFDKTGLISTIKVSRKVRRIDLSASGVVAVFTESEEAAYISYFDRFGNRISVEVKTLLSVSGYPLDFSVSPDGQKLAVVYYSTVNGIGESRLVIYDFQKGKKENSYVVASRENFYETDTMLLSVRFTDDALLYAVGSNGFVFYDHRKQTEAFTFVPMDHEILTVFTGSAFLGAVVRDEGEKRTLLFDPSGKCLREFPCPEEYSLVRASDSGVLFAHREELWFYNTGGRMRYHGNLVDAPLDILTFGGRSFLINTGSFVEKVILK